MNHLSSKIKSLKSESEKVGNGMAFLYDDNKCMNVFLFCTPSHYARHNRNKEIHLP